MLALKHLDEIDWHEMAQIEDPFFAKFVVRDHFYTPGYGQFYDMESIWGLEEVLERCLYNHSKRDESALAQVLEELEWGRIFLLKTAPFNPVLHWEKLANQLGGQWVKNDHIDSFLGTSIDRLIATVTSSQLCNAVVEPAKPDVFADKNSRSERERISDNGNTNNERDDSETSALVTEDAFNASDCTEVSCNNSNYGKMDELLHVDSNAIHSDWFAGAKEVTDAPFGIGGIDWINGPLINDRQEKYLRFVHHSLAPHNYETFADLRNGTGFKSLTGKFNNKNFDLGSEKDRITLGIGLIDDIRSQRGH